MNSTQSKVDSATVVDSRNKVAISYGFYFIGLLFILAGYFGPFIYFKIVKKKNFTPQTIGVKHAI